jgi:ATP-dependent Clp endopeptidase proteolytic subunit ClpP
MPVQPNEEETKVEFIERCMGDEGTVTEYGDENERTEYCTLQWNDANPQEEVEEAENTEEVTNAIATPKEDESKEDFMERCVTDEYDNEACTISWEENQPKEEEEEEEEEMVDAKDIFIYDMIGGGGVTAKQIVNELSKAGNNTPINLRINSAGGDVFEGIAIYNSLKKHNATINVEVEGLAASMASVIMLAGDTITASENSLIMIHNPSVGIQGESKDLTKKAELLDKIKDQMVGIYSSRTGMDSEQVVQMMDSETWLTANEALEVGLVTNVGESIKVSAVNETIFSNAPSWVKDFTKKQNPNIMNDIVDMLTNLKNKITGFTEEKQKEGVNILDEVHIKNEIVSLSEKLHETVAINDELVDTLQVVATHEATIEMLEKSIEEKQLEINKLNATPTSDKVVADKDPSLDLRGAKKETNGWDAVSEMMKK